MTAGAATFVLATRNLLLVAAVLGGFTALLLAVLDLASGGRVSFVAGVVEAAAVHDHRTDPLQRQETGHRDQMRGERDGNRGDRGQMERVEDADRGVPPAIDVLPSGSPPILVPTLRRRRLHVA